MGAANSLKITASFSPCANPSPPYELDDDPDVVDPEVDDDEDVDVVEVVDELALLSLEVEAGFDSFAPPPESGLESDFASDPESELDSDELLFDA